LGGGQEGLCRVEPGRGRYLETPDPWIETIGVLDGEALVVTAAGLVRGRPGGRFAPVPGGDDVASGVVHEGRFFGVTAPPVDAVLRYDPEGRLGEERLPAVARHVMVAGGE